eukprot:9249396-Pyramimonas_sp.AAC.1
MFANDKLVIQGFKKVSSDAPREQLDAPPVCPQLKRLEWHRAESNVPGSPVVGLKVPLNLVNTWGSHPTYGEEFKTKIDNMVEKFDGQISIMDESVSEPSHHQVDAPTKKMSGVMDGSTPLKKQKIPVDKIVPVESLDGDDLVSVVLPNLAPKKGTGNVSLSIKPGYRMAIMNKTDKVVEITAGSVLAYFGRGKFKTVQSLDLDDSVDQDSSLLFSLDSSESQCIYQGKITTAGSLYYQKLSSNNPANAKVCYHQLTTKPGNLKEFTLAREHNIVFTPDVAADLDGEGGEDGKSQTNMPSQTNVAALVPAKKWDTHATKLLWTMKWHTTGLMPVKPVVILTLSGDIPAGSALVIA